MIIAIVNTGFGAGFGAAALPGTVSAGTPSGSHDVPTDRHGPGTPATGTSRRHTMIIGPGAPEPLHAINAALHNSVDDESGPAPGHA